MKDLKEPLNQEMQDLKNKENNDVQLELENEEEKLSSYYTSNIFSKLLFAWGHYAMKKANKEGIEVKDFSGVSKEDKSSTLVVPILKEAEKSEKFTNKSLFHTIYSVHQFQIYLLFFLQFVIILFQTAQVLVYRSIIIEFKDKEHFQIYSVFYKVFLFVSIKMSKTFFHHQIKFYQQVLGVKTANQVAALIYEKVCRTSIFIKSQISEGEILNFIQVDSDTLNFLYTALPYIVATPFNLGISIYTVFMFFGKSFIYGIYTLIALTVIIFIIQFLFLRNTKIRLTKKDKRMRLTTHIFHILKILKLFGWEEEFAEKIDEKRNDELKNVKTILYLTAFRNFINSSIPMLISLTSITAYILQNGMMAVEDLFTGLEMIQKLSEPLVEIPQFLTDLLTCLISMNRIQGFLQTKDIEEYLEEEIEIKNKKDSIKEIIKFKNCNFGIKDENDKKNNNILLHNLDITILKGELVGILGETGSGKSCLVNSILKNLELINSEDPSTEFYIGTNKISYAPQDSWIMNGTIRENILFYSEYDEEKYIKVVNACQLNKDFENLLHGDLTEVGSSGVNISGGQRARISLARAIYKEADIYIFDDPISAVDTFVSMEIFHQAIKECLSDKTRIFVTHDLRNISYMDKIIYLEHFVKKFEGNSKDFSKSEHLKNIQINKQKVSSNKISNEMHKNKLDHFGRLLKDEDYNRGKISWKLYDLFFRVQGGYIRFLIIVFLTYLTIYYKTKGKLFISDWSDSSKTNNSAANNNEKLLDYAKIFFYGTLIQFIKEFIIAINNFRQIYVLHYDMIHTLIKAPINLFFDVVPIGQILNRLIFDLDKSSEIIWMFDKIIKCMFSVWAAILVCYQYNAYSLLVAPFLLFLSYLLVNYFINAGRDLYRLDSISRSPIVSLFSETILGITTIRTFKREKESKKKFYKRLDDHLGVMIYKYGLDNWFCMHLDIVSHFYLGFVIIYACFNIEAYTAANIGLVLSLASRFSEELLEAMEQGTKVEKSLVSLERCDAFRKLQSEKYEVEGVSEKDENLINWPNLGKIKFENYSMKYRPNCALSLNDINIEINSGEKIGIVGRTGSGKSSLTLSLFRIVEALNGKIEIDNLDISKIPLKKLRRNISIVPQEPFLLEGTIKTNIDPLNLYTNEEIMNVLEKLNLFEMLKNENKIDKDINTKIKEYGNNMSFGCRQLLCFARAILRKSKIIILDEATSAVDQKTEEIITKAIDELFKDSTVITIAHRINTVKKCDKIAVMDQGKIVEFDSTDKLIKDKKSIFYSMYYKNMEKTE